MSNVPSLSNTSSVQPDEPDDGELLTIKRKLYTQRAIDEQYNETDRETPSIRDRIVQRLTCSKSKCIECIESHFPVTRFLRTYHLKTSLLGDFLSGLSVSFMHIPQAMGYGFLVNLRPVHGLYSTFFPVLVYVLFGTSAFQSFGSNAVLALLTRTVIEREEEKFLISHRASTVYNSSSQDSAEDTSYLGPSEVEILAMKEGVAMACSFLVGAFLLGMGILRLGFLTSYLSVAFVGGFTTASGVHIASSQVPCMFGIKLKSTSGPGSLVMMYKELFSNIEHIQWAEIIITVICMIILFLVKECVNERYKHKMKMPVPIDLIVVIVATLVSYVAGLEEGFNVKVVGTIPSGIPAPSLPNLDNADSFMVDCFVMALLAFAMSISMAKLMSRMHGITIDDNQELIAYGSCNLFSGFFSCFPSGTGPPRCMILSSLGAKTTLNGIVTSGVILVVLVWIGPLFASLPQSVMAAMIVVSMKNVLMQVTHLPDIWSVNKIDFVTWVSTCAVSVFADLEWGLITGVVVSVLMVVVQTQLVSGSVLGMSEIEDVVLDVDEHKLVTQYDGVKIFHFPTSLYFATAEKFKQQLYGLVEDPFKVRKEPEKEVEFKIVSGTSENNLDFVYSCGHFTGENVSEESLEEHDVEGDINHVIIDCRAMTYMDISGYNMLLQIIKEYDVIGVTVSLFGCRRPVLRILEKSHFFDMFPRDRCFYDVFDAINTLNLKRKIRQNKSPRDRSRSRSRASNV